MTRRQRVALAAVIALLLGTYTSSSAAPANPITACPFTITAGGTYTLTADLTSASGDCITISPPFGASVTVALNGFSITGNGGLSIAIVADPPTKKVSIVGPGTISSFFAAIDLRSTTDVTVKRLTVNDVVVGVAFEQGSLYDTVIDTSVCLAGVEAGPKSLVKNVTVRGCAVGISVGDGSTVQESVAQSNGVGILGGDRVLVKNSQASQNDFTGIRVGASGGVSQSLAFDNGFDGASDVTKTGIAAGPRSNIKDNEVIENVIGIAVPQCPGTIQQNELGGNVQGDIVTGTGCTLKNDVIVTP